MRTYAKLEILKSLLLKYILFLFYTILFVFVFHWRVVFLERIPGHIYVKSTDDDQHLNQLSSYSTSLKNILSKHKNKCRILIHLSVMIGRCSLDNQLWRTCWYPLSSDGSNIRYKRAKASTRQRNTNKNGRGKTTKIFRVSQNKCKPLIW